jgi:hypothetical protein
VYHPLEEDGTDVVDGYTALQRGEVLVLGMHIGFWRESEKERDH